MERMMAFYPHWAYRSNKQTVKNLLNFLKHPVVNIWFENGKPVRPFEIGLQFNDNLLIYRKLLEQKLGIVPY